MEKIDSNIVIDKFFQYSKDLLCIIDNNGSFLKTNNEWENNLGYTTIDLEGESFLKFVDPYDIEKTIDAINKVTNNKGYVDCTNQYRHKDGFYHWLEWRFFPEDNKIFCSARDITRQKRTEEELFFLNKIHKTVVETVTVGLVFAKKGKFEWANNAFLKMFKCTLNEIKGQSINLFYKNKDEIKKITIDAISCFEKGEIYTNDIEVVNNENSIEWVYITGKPLVNGKINEGTVWMVQDITKQESMIADLKESKDQLQGIAQNIPGILFQFYYDENNKMGLNYLNGRTQEYLHLNNNDIDSFLDRFMARIPENELPVFLSSIQTAVETKSGWHWEGTFILPDGTKRILEGRSHPRQLNNQLIFDGIILDVTSAKESERAVAKGEAILKSTLQSISNAMLIVSFDNKILHYNQNFAKLFALPQEILDTKDEKLLQDHAKKQLFDPNAFVKKLKEIYNSNNPANDIILFKDGRVIERQFSPLIEEGPVKGGVWILRDITLQKKNEETLKLFKASINNANDSIFWLNKDAGFEYVNDKACVNLGYSRDELMKLNIMDIDPVITQEIYNDFWKGYKKKGSVSMNIESRHQRKDGSIYPVEVSTTHFWIGEKEHHISYTRDITERELSGKALIESEARARLFVENTLLPVALFDTNMYYIIANNKYNKVFKLGEQDIIGRYHYDVFPKIPDRWKDLHQRALKGEIIKNDIDKFVRQDGSIQWLRYELHPWYKGDKTIGGIVTFFEDITEKIKAIEALKETEQKMQRIFELAPIGLGITKEREIIDLNSQMSLICGYSYEKLKGANARILYPDKKEYKRVGEILYSGMKEKGIGEVECVWKRKDGKRIDVYTAITLIDRHNPSKGVVFTTMDITERKNYEKALEKQVLALTRPLDDIGNIEFSDLFNIDQLQELQDAFANATGVASLITYPDGTPITKPTNFCKLCNIVRSTEKGSRNCIKSDAEIVKYNLNGHSIQHCFSAGLWDAGASIILGGVHIANWLIGQVRDEEIQENEIIAYADEIGISREKFSKAFNEVNIMSKKQFQAVTNALYLLVNEISLKSYQNIQQARFISEQKKTEEELLKNQKLLLESQRIAKMGSWELDLKTNKLFWNKEAYLVYGYDDLSIEPTFEIFQQLVHPDDINYMKKHLETVIKEKKYYDIDCRIITPDGIIKYIIIVGEIVFDDNNEPSRLFGIIQDITQQKNYEVQLIQEKEKTKESEQRFKALHNASFGGIAIHDKGIILDCNKGLSEISGYSYEELIGRDSLLLIAEEYRDIVKDKIKQGYENPYEVVGLRKNGEQYPVGLETRNIPYKGIPAQSVEFRDMTKEKEIEREIILTKERAEESEYFLQESQRTGRIGSFKLNIITNHWQTTDTLDNIFGIPEKYNKDISGWLNIVHPDDRDAISDFYQSMSTNKEQTFNKEYRIIKYNTKELRWVHEVGKFYLNNKGRIIELLGIIQDITDRKLIEEERKRMNIELEERVKKRTTQLQQANKDLEAFAYSVSHDLRAPIRHIDGFLSLMYNQIKPANEKVEGYYNKIESATQNMSTMIDELLNFSRLGRTELKNKQVNITAIIKEVIIQYKPDYENRNIQWKINELPEINGDPALLKIVFENLVSNAIKYTAKKEKAIIQIGEKENYISEKICIFIKDNGTGFDMAYKDKLFGVFQRLHRNEEFEGIGIGLANVKQIIKKHNGEINAESEINNGATFYITLPRQKLL